MCNGKWDWDYWRLILAACFDLYLSSTLIFKTSQTVNVHKQLYYTKTHWHDCDWLPGRCYAVARVFWSVWTVNILVICFLVQQVKCCIWSRLRNTHDLRNRSNAAGSDHKPEVAGQRLCVDMHLTWAFVRRRAVFQSFFVSVSLLWGIVGLTVENIRKLRNAELHANKMRKKCRAEINGFKKEFSV